MELRVTLTDKIYLMLKGLNSKIKKQQSTLQPGNSMPCKTLEKVAREDFFETKNGAPGMILPFHFAASSSFATHGDYLVSRFYKNSQRE